MEIWASAQVPSPRSDLISQNEPRGGRAELVPKVVSCLQERRAGALDSTKDQALSKDSLQHVPATAGHTETIAAAADILAARHSDSIPTVR